MSAPAALTRPDRIASARMLDDARRWTAQPHVHEPAPATWTWQDCRTAARVAASRHAITPGVAREADLFEVALSGVALAVALDPHIPWSDAVAAGQRDIWDAVSATFHHHGLNSDGPMPRFAAFWSDWLHNQATPPTRCVSEMTLTAVLDALPDRHREALAAFAFTDSMEDAADLLGCSLIAFRQRVRTARVAALTLWFDHETPPTLTRLPINRRDRDRTCPAGHSITGENVEIERLAGRIIERCKTCRSAQRAAWKATQ